MIIEDEIIGSHTDDHELQDDDNLDEVFEQFGIEKDQEDDPPAKEEVKEEPKQESKTLKVPVKINKEQKEVEISEDQIPELYEKSFALDKERARRTEYEQHLDRVAKLQGFNSHAELISNLDRIEQEKVNAQKDQFEQLKNQVIQDLVDTGVDEQTAREYAENNPLVQAARTALLEKEFADQQARTREFSESIKSQWNEVFQTFPDIEKRDVEFIGGRVVFGGETTPDWLTPEMVARLEKGYSPLDAFKLTHEGKLSTQAAKKAEQRVIKEQQLGIRSKVETNAASDSDKAVPAELASAFAAFGLPADAAKKYVK